MKRALTAPIAFILVVCVDQYTKYLILKSLALGQFHTVIPGIFNLTLTLNKGAAFGMMSSLPDEIRHVALGFATFVAITVVVVLMYRDYRSDLVGRTALCMILGGAVGNIIDRLFREGMVVDFLDFYFNSYHWPAFNVADSCICIGVIILIFRRVPKEIKIS